MRVALVTNWGERCGNAEYALNLVKHSEHTDIKIVQRPLTFEHIFAETRDVDVIHFNCVTPEFRSITTQMWPWPVFKEGGKKLTMMLQDSSQGKTEKTASMIHKDSSGRWSFVFDCVAVHEKSIEGRDYPSNVRVIPHGILQVDTSDIQPQQKIGIVGFPMPWKGFTTAALAARQLGLGLLAIMPASHHIEVKQTAELVLEICPQAVIITDWLSQQEVIRRMAECFVTVFPYETRYEAMKGHKFEGISGGVRFGIASGRPVVISRNSLFKDLFDYQDEFYIHEQDTYLEYTIEKVVWDWNARKEKAPRRIIQDMNWKKCAGLYNDMWREARTNFIEV